MSVPLSISRVTVEVRHEPGRGDQATLEYRLHQSVADLFGEQPSRTAGEEGERQYLWRALRSLRTQHVILVLSRLAPLPLAEVPTWPTRRTWRIETKPYNPALPAGRELDYEVRLNATRIDHSSRAGRGKRVDVWEAIWGADHETPLSPAAVYGDYLQRKLAGAAEVLTTAVTARGEVGVRRPRGGDDAMRFVAVDLCGRLCVTDGAKLLDLLSAGIGRQKSFGCGLICLSRPGTLLPNREPAAAQRALGV
ncbi:MAG: type I-E CRISPR-associated protein Cas6/Cse3/CasE [Fimbriimonadaceae bacterium]|nr:type I-E CRISPR-associated protein Cas6/Cse3/CasE [Fimbriimonadaceae bacterium]